MQAEMLVLSMCAMGFLNKVMDAIGVELEKETYAETKALMDTDVAQTKAGSLLDSEAKPFAFPTRDSIRTKLRIVQQVPSALWLDSQYVKGWSQTWHNPEPETLNPKPETRNPKP